MDEFKLRSIDDFDNDFITSVRQPAPAPQPAVQAQPAPQARPSLVPEYNPNASQNQNPAISDPLYTPDRMSDVPVEPLNIEANEKEEKAEKPKAGAGALIGKIAAIVMLVVTVLVFVCGCFLTVFLDNKGSALFGHTLNTLASDTTVNETTIKKGALIIGDVKEGIDDSAGNHLAVPTTLPAAKGCDIVTINEVKAEEPGSGKSYVTSRPGNPATAVYTKDSSYGVVNIYLPVLGGLLSFAMDNAIWFCAMFVLLAAVCICVLVLINWSVANKAKPKEEE